MDNIIEQKEPKYPHCCGYFDKIRSKYVRYAQFDGFEVQIDTATKSIIADTPETLEVQYFCHGCALDKARGDFISLPNNDENSNLCYACAVEEEPRWVENEIEQIR